MRQLSGASAVCADSALDHCHRDVRIVPQHLTVSPQLSEVAGRMLPGLQSGAPERQDGFWSWLSAG